MVLAQRLAKEKGYATSQNSLPRAKMMRHFTDLDVMMPVRRKEVIQLSTRNVNTELKLTQKTSAPYFGM